MANCKEFQDLTPIERILVVGKLVHSVQSSTMLYQMALRIITIAEQEGLFEGVTFNPPREMEPEIKDEQLN